MLQQTYSRLGSGLQEHDARLAKHVEVCNEQLRTQLQQGQLLGPLLDALRANGQQQAQQQRQMLEKAAQDIKAAAMHEVRKGVG